MVGLQSFELGPFPTGTLECGTVYGDMTITISYDQSQE